MTKRPYLSGASVAERFDFYHMPEPNSGCWLWTGALTKGYGHMFNRGTPRMVKAHHVAWRLFRGEIPAGLYILHRCDNRQCVNPDHLFLGTQEDNMKDMSAKGRHFTRTRPDRVAKGERNGFSKLTRNQADEIRASTEQTKILVERYQICGSVVREIRAGTRWRREVKKP